MYIEYDPVSRSWTLKTNHENGYTMLYGHDIKHMLMTAISNKYRHYKSLTS